LKLGTVSNVAYSDTCTSSFGPTVGSTLGDGGANPNFRCVTMTVSCAGMADMTATVALSAAPPGVTSKGLVVTQDGYEGTQFFAPTLPAAWYGDGFDIAAVAWTTPWECPRGSPSSSPTTCNVDSTPIASRSGLLDVACRPATVFAWIHDAAQLPGGAPLSPKGTAFCGFGYSSGSGALWYALLHYGLSVDFDYVGMSASTPYARVDVGCDPASATKMIATPCSNLASDPMVPQQYDANDTMHAALIDQWSSTSSCDGTPSPDELAYWKRNSIVSTGATYDIPTPVTTYDCIDPANVDDIPGMNALLFAQLRVVDPTGARFKSTCTLDGTNGTCSGELALDGGALQLSAIDDMEKGCLPIKR
jgi:hypothetical protein